MGIIAYCIKSNPRAIPGTPKHPNPPSIYRGSIFPPLSQLWCQFAQQVFEVSDGCSCWVQNEDLTLTGHWGPNMSIGLVSAPQSNSVLSLGNSAKNLSKHLKSWHKVQNPIINRTSSNPPWANRNTSNTKFYAIVMVKDELGTIISQS